MNKLNTFTSTGSKILHHPDFFKSIKNDGHIKPISIQLAPTSVCQLKCNFCSNANRQTNESLSFEDVEKILSDFKTLGAKTVEFTGGGDPCLYTYINQAIALANSLGYKIGLITNGVALKKIHDEHLLKLTWIRVSMNALEYVRDLDFPEIPESTTLGFSYVMNKFTNTEIFNRIDKYTEKYNPEYIRVVPDCQTDEKTQEENNKKYSKLIESFGGKYFYQTKKFQRPDKCWWGYVKPFVLHNRYVYPCSSVVLNSDSEEQFHSKYQWYNIDNIFEMYGTRQAPFDNKSCDHCVFTNQNNVVESLMNTNTMEAFV